MMKANIYIVAENDLNIYVRLFKSWDLNVHKVVCFLPKEFKKVDNVEIISPTDLLDDNSPNKILFVFESDYPTDGLDSFWNNFTKKFSALGTYFVQPGGKYERLYRHLDGGECWINCGANVGEMVLYAVPKERAI